MADGDTTDGISSNGNQKNSVPVPGHDLHVLSRKISFHMQSLAEEGEISPQMVRSDHQVMRLVNLILDYYNQKTNKLCFSVILDLKKNTFVLI